MAVKKEKDLAKSISLNSNFWSDFSKNYWEKKPLLCKSFKSALQKINQDEVFRLLVSYSDRCRKNKEAAGFKFFIQGLQTNESDVLQVLPFKKDKSLLGYHARMQKLFSDYCLVCDELLNVNSDQQQALSEFTDDLYSHVGFPNRFSEIGLYLGNYRKTPFGVHVDHCGVFSFPVEGVKKFRLWSSEFVKKNPDLDRAFKYEKFKKNSQVLTVVPGDLAYWPSSSWHIAESDGSFSATWSLGVWVDRSHNQMFFDGINNLLTQKMMPVNDSTMTAVNGLCDSKGEVTQLPVAFAQSLQKFKKISSLEISESFLIFWMKHSSLYGFKSLPKSDLKLNINSKIKLKNIKFKILWHSSQVDRRKIYFCFAGIHFETTKTNPINQLIQQLNGGNLCQIGDFLKGSRFQIDLKLLNELATAGRFCLIFV